MTLLAPVQPLCCQAVNLHLIPAHVYNGADFGRAVLDDMKRLANSQLADRRCGIVEAHLGVPVVDDLLLEGKDQFPRSQRSTCKRKGRIEFFLHGPLGIRIPNFKPLAGRFGL